MWRIANCIYRAFRNTATHYCSQDVCIPYTKACSTDDDSNQKRKRICSNTKNIDISEILKKNQFSYNNIEELQNYFKKFSLQQIVKKLNDIEHIENKTIECVVKEVPSISSPGKTGETLDALLETDETCMTTLKNLSNLHEETMSIINLQIAVDALESGDLQFGIETLQQSAKTGTNAAALYNLGICYEQGIGVEKSRAKACDYYRQASSLGHINAQFNLTLLSNHIDINENEDETSEDTITKDHSSSLHHAFCQFTLSNHYKEEHSINDYQLDFRNQTVPCFS